MKTNMPVSVPVPEMKSVPDAQVVSQEQELTSLGVPAPAPPPEGWERKLGFASTCQHHSYIFPRSSQHKKKFRQLKKLNILLAILRAINTCLKLTLFFGVKTSFLQREITGRAFFGWGGGCGELLVTRHIEKLF
jgi:hypothetical protein